MKNRNIFIMILIYILITGLFISCNKTISYKENKNFVKDQYLDVEKIWDDKIRFLCETNCKDFDNPDNLKKDYILDVCKYYKMLSDTNIEYDKDINKYIISEIEVKDIVNDLLGINDFKFHNNDCYDQSEGRYIFDEYESFFNDKIYENKQIKKLDDQRYEFKLLIKDNKFNKQYSERYIIKQNDKKSFYIAAKSSKKD